MSRSHQEQMILCKTDSQLIKVVAAFDLNVGSSPYTFPSLLVFIEKTIKAYFCRLAEIFPGGILITPLLIKARMHRSHLIECDACTSLRFQLIG
ncbi:hypothetical protein D3C78_1700020 [compost metagenome]